MPESSVSQHAAGVSTVVSFTEKCFNIIRFILRECAELDVSVKQADLHYVTPAVSKIITEQMIRKISIKSVEIKTTKNDKLTEVYSAKYGSCSRREFLSVSS